MTTTPISPPPNPSPNGATEPIAAPDAAAIITPDADPTSIADNEDRWAELGEQLTQVFESRAATSESPSDAPDTAGGTVTPTDESPAGTEPSTPPAVTSPSPDPKAPPAAQEGEGSPVPEPSDGHPLVPDFDPFAVPGQPTSVATATQPVEPGTATDPTQTQPSAIPPGYIDFMGQPLPINEAQTMRDTYAWAQSLTPDEMQAINVFVQQNRTGQRPAAPQSVPVQPVPSAPQYPSAQEGFAPQPVGFGNGQAGQPIAPPPPLDPATVDDPALAAYLNQQNQFLAYQQQQLAAQQQQLAETSQAVTYQQQAAQQAQVAQQTQDINQAKWDFAVRYSLTPAELDIAETRLAAAQLLPSLIERRQGDVYQSILDGFETVVWTSPDFRQRLIAQSTAPAIEDANAIRQRAASLGSLGGSGGSVPRTDPVPETSQDRHKAMVEAIRAGMNQNPS